MSLFKRGLLCAALFFALTSCITVKPTFPDPVPVGKYPEHAKSTAKAVIVRIQWHDTFADVNAACEAIGAAPVPGESIVGCFDHETGTIHAVEPANFNDEFRLMILGHEFWHALGATHP